jgi:predicted flap endonuclease-1-like 5' DNA nuclease
MPHLTLELLLWMLLAFLIGCILGCLFRKLFGGEAETAAAPAAAAAATAATATAATAAPKAHAPAPAAPKPAAPKPAAPMPAAQPVSSGKPSRPKGLASARGGKSDNLQIISGVGPKLEKTLHGLGFFHFDQIANWSKDEVDWVDEHLRFKGRIEREEWIPQCKLLADGDMDQFNKLYGTGGLRNSQGQRKSGTRTRRTASKKKK